MFAKLLTDPGPVDDTSTSVMHLLSIMAENGKCSILFIHSIHSRIILLDEGRKHIVKSSTLVKCIIDVITGTQKSTLKGIASKTLSNLMESGNFL
jgi:type I restriction-modification system DNA methylase subunit